MVPRFNVKNVCLTDSPEPGFSGRECVYFHQALSWFLRMSAMENCTVLSVNTVLTFCAFSSLENGAVAHSTLQSRQCKILEYGPRVITVTKTILVFWHSLQQIPWVNTSFYFDLWNRASFVTPFLVLTLILPLTQLQMILTPFALCSTFCLSLKDPRTVCHINWFHVHDLIHKLCFIPKSLRVVSTAQWENGSGKQCRNCAMRERSKRDFLSTHWFFLGSSARRNG